MLSDVSSLKTDFLAQEVDRKAFILITASLLLAVTGISGLLKHLSSSLSGTQLKAPATNDFGKRAYGS